MIKATTFDFLRELAINNDRNWFQAHKEEYNLARQNTLGFTSELLNKIITVDPLIPADLKAENCLMRIYRDIRFSKDKTPYKTNFGIGISVNGKNFDGPGYYIHLQPDQSFIAGGYWMPVTDHLKAIRQEIDYNGSEFHEIIDSKSFQTYFGELSTEDSLKTSPKGYSTDHRDIEYLKLKSFIGIHYLKDEALNNPKTLNTVTNVVEKLYPLMVFLRNAIA
jgi:uncharacterized protein (TIGR02453 family)